MIDFSKARASTRRLTHSEPWELGNEEDGYLKGLGHLIRLWTQLTVDPEGWRSCWSTAPTVVQEEARVLRCTG